MRRRWSPAAGRAALLLLGALLLPGRGAAQQTRLTITNNALAIPSNTAIDSTAYNAGWVCATGNIGYNALANSGGARVVTVSIRATGAITGGKAGKLAEWEWRTGTPCSATAAGTGWTPLAVTNTTVASGSIRSTGPAAGRRLQGTIYFRLLLDWATDLGGSTLSIPQLVFTVSQ